MGYEAKKTEHAGAKHGRGAYWGPKYDAKKESNKVRRRISKEEIQRQLLWKQSLAYGKKKAKQLGIKSEKDIQRIVDEYRRGTTK